MMDYGLSGENIICFAGEDWWYHHPHSKNHILKRLAQQEQGPIRQLDFDGIAFRVKPGFLSEDSAQAEELSEVAAQGTRRSVGDDAVNLPFYGTKATRKLNRLMLIFQLRLAMLILGMRKPVLWVAIPPAADLVGHLGEQMLLYQVSDKYEANEDSALSA